MRVRRKQRDKGADVAMSPLIDCVFLLLIFFLVTSVLKRWERQIPISRADPTAAVAVEAENDTYLMAIDTQGNVYREEGRDRKEKVLFVEVSDLPGFLQDLARSREPGTPIEISVERETPFQRVIDTLDVLQLQGFTNVRSRIRDNEL